MVTVRKLEFEPDTYAFADKVGVCKASKTGRGRRRRGPKALSLTMSLMGMIAEGSPVAYRTNCSPRRCWRAGIRTPRPLIRRA